MRKELEIVPGASHLFEETGALEAAAVTSIARAASCAVVRRR
jgi:hypothetical protein